MLAAAAEGAPAGAEAGAEEIRCAVAAFCDEHWDPDLEVRDWWSLLAGSGFASPMLPVTAGGLGYGRDQAAVVSLALAERGVLGPPSGLGRMLAAPTIAAHGDQAQIDRYVPQILRGDVGWCQLFSEPNAGSDLASLQCRAERDGDEWVITGQKVWTSGGHVADLGMLLARTDPNAPKHSGITWFAFEMDQPGVEVRPLTEMTGRAMFNEVFIDGARARHDAAVGGVNNGWRVAITTLMVERASLGSSGREPRGAIPGLKGKNLARPAGPLASGAVGRDDLGSVGIDLWRTLVDLARKNGRIGSRVLRDELMRLYGLIEINRLSILRAKAGGQRTGAEPNIAKLTKSELVRSFREVGLQVIGADGMLAGCDDAQSSGMIGELALFSPAPSIYGGTDQVQRNIIGERVLRLPREPAPPRDTPFNELPKN